MLQSRYKHPYITFYLVLNFLLAAVVFKMKLKISFGFLEVKKKPVPSPRTAVEKSHNFYDSVQNLLELNNRSESCISGGDISSEVDSIWPSDSCDVFTQTDCDDVNNAGLFYRDAHQAFNRHRDISYYDNNYVPNCNLAEDSSDFSGFSPESRTGSDLPDSSIDSCRDSLISSSDSIDNNCILGAERLRVGDCLDDFEETKVIERRTLLNAIRAEFDFDSASCNSEASLTPVSPEYRTKSIGSLINFFEENHDDNNSWRVPKSLQKTFSVFSPGRIVQERVFQEILNIQARETNSLSSSPLPESLEYASVDIDTLQFFSEKPESAQAPYQKLMDEEHFLNSADDRESKQSLFQVTNRAKNLSDFSAGYNFDSFEESSDWDKKHIEPISKILPISTGIIPLQHKIPTERACSSISKTAATKIARETCKFYF